MKDLQTITLTEKTQHCKGDIVTIYRYALQQNELDAEGDAELFERIEEHGNTEVWWVKFEGEHKFVRRTIAKIGYDSLPEEKEVKMEKFLDKDGKIRYRYFKMSGE